MRHLLMIGMVACSLAAGPSDAADRPSDSAPWRARRACESGRCGFWSQRNG